MSELISRLNRPALLAKRRDMANGMQSSHAVVIPRFAREGDVDRVVHEIQRWSLNSRHTGNSVATKLEPKAMQDG